VPHIVERLGDVKEGRRAQYTVLKAFHNLIDYPMRLLYRGMARSKAKLVTGNEVGKVHIGLESLQEERGILNVQFFSIILLFMK
jgi:hypothetical protein